MSFTRSGISYEAEQYVNESVDPIKDMVGIDYVRLNGGVLGVNGILVGPDSWVIVKTADGSFHDVVSNAKFVEEYVPSIP